MIGVNGVLEALQSLMTLRAATLVSVRFELSTLLTLDYGKEMYTLTGETGYVWCAVSSQAVENEQYFLFDCPAYAPLMVQSADLFQQGPYSTVQ